MYDSIYFFDVPYKLLRKSLPKGVYVLGRKVFGRLKKFCSPEHAMMIVALYREHIPIEGKVILEIGPGNDISTAIMMIMLGAERVYLVDKISKLTEKGHNNDIDFIKAFLPEIKKTGIAIKGMQEIPAPEIADKICFIDSYFTDSERLFEALGGVKKVDCIVSHQVLEHIDSPDEAFKNMRTMLKPGGVMFHEIDFSDHTMHIFNKYPILRQLCRNHSLAHLYYSDKFWKVCNDTVRLNMNRYILPDYLALFKGYGFTVSGLSRRNTARKQEIHHDILSRIGDEKLKTDDYLQLSSVLIQAKL
jgi:SAM-dependent methyltransferase